MIKRRKPIRRISPKRAKEVRAYSKLRKTYLEANPWCHVCIGEGEIKIRPAVDLHHKLGRIGILLLDVRHYMAVCRVHHEFLHSHPKWALERGYILSNWNSHHD